MSLTATVATGGSGEAEAVVTRSPWGPCVAAWLFPGGGHLAIGQVVPGLVFAAVVLATFATGVLLQGTVYARDPEQPLSNLALVANLGAGPLDLWARHVTFGRLAYRIPDSRVDPVTFPEDLVTLLQAAFGRKHVQCRRRT